MNLENSAASEHMRVMIGNKDTFISDTAANILEHPDFQGTSSTDSGVSNKRELLFESILVWILKEPVSCGVCT